MSVILVEVSGGFVDDFFEVVAELLSEPTIQIGIFDEFHVGVIRRVFFDNLNFVKLLKYFKL